MACLLAALSHAAPGLAQRQPGAPLQGLNPPQIEAVMAKLTPELADCWVYFEAARKIYSRANRPREEVAEHTAFRNYVRTLLETALNRRWIEKSVVDTAVAAAKHAIVEKELNTDTGRFTALQASYGPKCTALARNFDGRLMHWILVLGY